MVDVEMTTEMTTVALPFLLWPFFCALFLLFFAKKTKASQYFSLILNVLWAVLFLLLLKDLSAVRALQKETSFFTVFEWSWLPILKSSFRLGLDGLNAPLIGLNVFLSLVLSFYTLDKERLTSSYSAFFWVLNGASVGSLLASDALTFYLFWEFMLIPMYFLIGVWGSKNRIYATLKFFAFTMAGSLAMLLSIILLVYKAGVPSLAWHDIAKMPLSFDGGLLSLQGIIFLGLLIGFAVKIPLWPLHSWLPDAHAEAPTGASVVLAGILLKLGVYGIARWCLPLFPEASEHVAPTMMLLGVVGIVLGAFAAWRQTDIKRLIAFSSVSHLGFMVLGLFALREEALQGALFQNLAHGLSTGALFLIFGIIYDRTHTRNISDYGGLVSSSPFLATSFVIAMFASIGLPGLPGFVGEFLILSGTFMSDVSIASPVTIVALSGVLLGAIYMLSLTRRFVFGPSSKLLDAHPLQLGIGEKMAVVIFVGAMLFMGFGANIFLQWMKKG